MAHLVAELERIAEQAASVIRDAMRSGEVAGVRDADLERLLATASVLMRAGECLAIEAAGVIADRSDTAVRSDRLTSRLGCRDLREVLSKVTGVSGNRAGQFVAAARGVVPRTNWTTGAAVEAEYPGMRAALIDGAVGVDGVVAVVRQLHAAHVPWEAKRAADAALAESARGVILHADGSVEESGPRPDADTLRLQAQVWVNVLDPDGVEPRDERAMRLRGITLRPGRDGLYRLRGDLLPEVAGQFQRIADAMGNPKVAFVVDVDGTGIDVPPDRRTHGQKLHDVFATVVNVAARADEVPTIGGAAPTLLVSVDERDLRENVGTAHVDGVVQPVTIGVARHIACTGFVQRVIRSTTGGIVALGTPERVFNAHQRKAITLRDGGCVIPGCRVRASWCEIHHVTAHSRGGPTHINNGVLLCWHHHRTLDTSGWRIRMRVDGIPEVRGPGWWDPTGRWRVRDRTASYPPIRV